MPVIVLSGDEEFELARRAKLLVASLVDPAWASVNFVRLENPPLKEIIDASGLLPFGPGNKVVLIDKCDLFTKKKTKGSDDKGKSDSEAKGKDKLLDEFEHALAAVHSSTHLIFSCPFNFDSALKTSKIIQKHAKQETFAKEKYYLGSRNATLEKWCRNEAKNFAVTIQDEAITYLLDGTEANLRQISSELEKAATYIFPSKHITYDTVVKLSPYHSHVFVLCDRWLSGQGKEALMSADELLSRQSAMPIVAMMQTMLSKWIQLKALIDKFNAELPTGPGLTRRELPLPELVRKVSAELKAPPFLIEKDLKRVSRLPMQRLIEKRTDLVRLEQSIKTGLMPESHALQIFLAG